MSAAPTSLVPQEFIEAVSRYAADGGPSGQEWARGVRRLVAEVVDEWGLKVTGPPMTGWTAVVLPVERAGEPLVLKAVWPHSEVVAEHIALRTWAGDGAVRLVRADPARGVLLLERLDHGRDLHGLWDEEAGAIAGRLLARLHVPAPPNVPGLRELVTRHLARMPGEPRMPRRIVTRVTGLASELLADPAAESTLIHSDCHFGNVLAAGREPWLVIDPKPLAGHPGFELQPLLRNRTDELGTGAAFRWGVRRRLEVVCEAMDLDADEGRAWAIVHTGIEILWSVEDTAAASLHVAIFKALDG